MNTRLIVACVVLGPASAGAAAGVSARPEDALEIDLLARYCQIQRCPVVILGVAGTGPFVSVEPLKGESRFAAVVGQFEREFGVQFSAKVPPAAVTVSQSTSVLQLSPSGPAKLAASFEAGSLMRRALMRSIKAGRLRTRDGVVEISFRLRPWISDRLKRTERVEGTVTAIRAGSKIEIPIAY